MSTDQVTYAMPFTRRPAWRLLALFLFLFALLAGGQGRALAAGNDPGGVYVMSNAADGNAVLAYDRAADGALSMAGAYATGGLGAGGGLGSQGALVLSQNQRWLLAVNAGSHDISVFAVGPQGLTLVGVTPSGGERPISVAVHGRLVYALNAGGSGNISGFDMAPDGSLTALPGSTQPLSNGGVGAAPGPAQISFSPNGRHLVVTEKDSNLIVVYQVGADGLASPPAAYPSAGTTPFGFSFTRRGFLLVSEAFGGTANASAASSYALGDGGPLLISASVPTHQTAACWLVVTGNGKYAYTTNAGSGTISGYRVGTGGELSLLDPDGLTADTGPGSRPLDAALSGNSRYLYVLAAGVPAIAGFQIGADGSLSPLGQVAIPEGAVGIASR